MCFACPRCFLPVLNECSRVSRKCTVMTRNAVILFHFTCLRHYGDMLNVSALNVNFVEKPL